MKRLLINSEAANYLGFSPNTLNNSRTTGLLGGVKAPSFAKIGKSVRYDQNDLEEWLAQFDPRSSTGGNAA